MEVIPEKYLKDYKRGDIVLQDYILRVCHSLF